jgi:hypothetical protein
MFPTASAATLHADLECVFRQQGSAAVRRSNGGVSHLSWMSHCFSICLLCALSGGAMSATFRRSSQTDRARAVRTYTHVREIDRKCEKFGANWQKPVTFRAAQALSNKCCAAKHWKSRVFKKTSHFSKIAFDSCEPPPYKPLQDEGSGCFWRPTNSLLSLVRKRAE